MVWYIYILRNKASKDQNEKGKRYILRGMLFAMFSSLFVVDLEPRGSDIDARVGDHKPQSFPNKCRAHVLSISINFTNNSPLL